MKKHRPIIRQLSNFGEFKNFKVQEKNVFLKCPQALRLGEVFLVVKRIADYMKLKIESKSEVGSAILKNFFMELTASLV